MKKIFYGGMVALSILLAASGCSKETSESATDNTVKFKTVLGKQTKVGEFTNSSWVNGNQLAVHAYPVGMTSLVNTFNLTKENAGWTYSPPFNQPGYALRYYSIYPLDHVTDQTVTTGSYSFKYAVQAVAAQQDLLAAAPAPTNNAAVTLTFNHVLSQVNFAVVNTLNLKIQITNISVNNVNSQGTYTFGATTPWGTLGTKASYAYTPVAGTNTTTGTAPAGIVYMGNGGSDYTRTNALMLMPQAFAAETDGTFSFDYKVTYSDAGGDDVDLTGSIVANLCDFDTNTWLPGKRYLYVMDFSNFLTGGPITFTVDVNSWENDGHNDIAETLIVSQPSKGSIEAAIVKHAEANKANSALKVFPIAVPTDIDAALTIAAIPETVDAFFDDADQIRIEFPTAVSVSFLNLDVALTDWTKTTSGRVVIFTKETAIP